MRTLFLILASAACLFATGGQQEPPPFNTQEGPNLLANGDFETGDLTGWTPHACVSIDSTVKYEGDYGAKGVSCPDITFPLLQTFATGTTGSVMFRGRFKFDANMTGSLSFEFRGAGNTHLQTVALQNYRDQAVGGDWIDLYREFAIPERHFGNLSARIRTNGATGTFWMDNLELVPTWKPLRNFVKFPNYHGFLFQGVNPWQCSEFGTEEICGVSEIIPPNGETLSSMTLSVKLATAAGCATGVVDSVSVPTPIATQLWSFDGSGLTLDTDYFLCSSLLRTSDSTVLDTYPDHKIIPKTTAYRDTLVNWIDDRGRWYHDGRAKLPWGTYSRGGASGPQVVCVNCKWAVPNCGSSPDQATAKDCYIYDVAGYSKDGLPKSVGVGGINTSDTTAFLADMARAKFNLSIWKFSTSIVMDPRDSNDELTPALAAMRDFGIAYLQIANRWFGHLFSETETPVAPAAPSLAVASSGGVVDSAYVWVRVSGVKMFAVGELAAVPQETAASAAARNTNALTGSTNKVTVTVPTCSTEVPLGFWVYATTSSTTDEPAISVFTRQSNMPVPCGGNFELTTVRDTKIFAPTTDATHEFYRPYQGAGLTDVEGWTIAANKITTGKGAGFYLCDECVPGSFRLVHRKAKVMREAAPGLIMFGTPGYRPAAVRLFRDVLDVPTNDPYPYFRGGNGPDEFLVTSAIRSTQVFTTATNSPNALANTNRGNLIEVDMAADELALATYGSRPSWIVIQQWGNGEVGGIPYSELRRNAYKALIGQQNRGTIGGIITWGWIVNSNGLTFSVKSRGHTEAFNGHIKLSDEIMGIEDVWLADPKDSSHLGTGTVVSAVSHNLTLPTTTCKSFYSTPIRFVTKRLADADWIFATNLCADSMTATFTLNAPADDAIAVSHPDGAKLPIAGGQVSIPLNDFGVGAIRISRPVGARATLNKSTT